MHFEYPQKVLFKYCDPAGIVFFPRYAELLNDAVETFFADVLKWPFEEMHPEAGVPTAQFSMDFKAPSFHGDMLNLQITIQKVGRASLELRTKAQCETETRFIADQTLVCVDGAGRPMSWPDDVRTRLKQTMESHS